MLGTADEIGSPVGKGRVHGLAETSWVPSVDCWEMREMILYSILSTHHFSFAFVGIAAKSEAQWKIGTWWHNAEACPLTKISGVFSNFEKNNLSNADQIYVKFNKKIWILRLNNYDQMGDKDVCIKCSLMYLPFDITQTTYVCSLNTPWAQALSQPTSETNTSFVHYTLLFVLPAGSYQPMFYSEISILFLQSLK